jgi:hypothetical protein
MTSTSNNNHYKLYLIYYSPDKKSNDYYIIHVKSKNLYDFLVKHQNQYLNTYLYQRNNRDYLNLYKDSSFTIITQKEFLKIKDPVIIYNSD